MLPLQRHNNSLHCMLVVLAMRQSWLISFTVLVGMSDGGVSVK